MMEILIANSIKITLPLLFYSILFYSIQFNMFVVFLSESLILIGFVFYRIYIFFCLISSLAYGSRFLTIGGVIQHNLEISV